MFTDKGTVKNACSPKTLECQRFMPNFLSFTDKGTVKNVTVEKSACIKGFSLVTDNFIQNCSPST